MKKRLWPNVPAAGPGFSALLLALAVIAAGAPPGVAVRGAWMRSIIPARPAAGYMTLVNDGDAAVSLVGASSPGCGTLMLHRSVERGGQEMMEMLASVRVPAHGSVTFAPGGYHLMCTQPGPAVAPGGTVPITLRFDNGMTLTVGFPVRGALGN